MHFMRGAIASMVLLVSACATETAYNSMENMDVDCALSPIQYRPESSSDQIHSYCRRRTQSNLRLRSTEHYRHFELQSGFVDVVYRKAHDRTYAKYKPVKASILDRFTDIRGKAFGFSEPGKMSAGGNEFEIIKFNSSKSVSCMGYSNLGSAKYSGYADHLYGYACRYGSKMTEGGLKEILDALTIEHRS